MSIGDFINSLAETVKGYTPDLTPVYSYTSDTISKVNNAVKTGVGPKLTKCLPGADSCTRIGQKLSESLPDDEGQAKIGRFLWNFGKNAAVWGICEVAKWVPGGYFIHQTVMRSLPVEKKENLKQKVKTMETRISRLEKQVTASRNTQNGDEISSSGIKPYAQNVSLCLDSKTNFQKISKL